MSSAALAGPQAGDSARAQPSKNTKARRGAATGGTSIRQRSGLPAIATDQKKIRPPRDTVRFLLSKLLSTTLLIFSSLNSPTRVMNLFSEW